MKWLAAGLTFVNFATISGLLFGMFGSGLSCGTAIAALGVGVAAAILTYLGTLDVNLESPGAAPKSAHPSKRRRFPLDRVAALPAVSPRRYRNVWKSLLAAIFAIFAVRCFCWLLYIDGNELKIQSPNNLGDLALHITHIKYFANGVPLWPANPIYVFSAHLRYPAGIDLFNALLYLVHVDLTRGLVWTGLLASLATFYALYRWGGEFGVAGFLLNGGVAGFQIVGTLQFLDYQDVKDIAWKSIPLTMFLTQRGLLYAIPLGLLLLWHWREKFWRTAPVGGGADPGKHSDRLQRSRLQSPLPFWVELSLYASLPLYHVHTFMALSIVLVCFFLLGNAAMREHVVMLLGYAFFPATFCVWLITDHFRAHSVMKWYPGWVQTEEDFARPFLEFWWVNFGILIPLVLALIGLCVWRAWKKGWQPATRVSEELGFLLPAVAIFLFGFFVKTAPWGWDNLKLMVWAYFLALPFLWTNLIGRWPVPARVAVCIALFGSGFVSLWGGLVAGRDGFGFADRAELDGVGVAVRDLPAEARFAAYPTYNHPLLLQGRKVVLGYPGHLWTQGFDDYAETQKQLRNLMNGDADWREIARRLHVRYIFWGHEENLNYPISKRPWEKTITPVDSGNWGAIYDLEETEASLRQPGGLFAMTEHGDLPVAFLHPFTK